MNTTRKLFIAASIIFGIFTAWWTYLAFTGGQGGNKSSAELFAAVYGLMALFGGIVGLQVSKKWGGFKSLIGRAIGLISLGLLAQEFGQLVISYLGSKTDEFPYPSIGDLGYFGSVLLYIAGLIVLIKALKFKGTLSQSRNIVLVVLLPLLLLVGSYEFFLRDYVADFGNKLAILLDFGYPLGQAFYFSLALLAFLLSRKYLGGVMKTVIGWLIVALLVQYASDFSFLYVNSKDLWVTAGINDYMYLVSYFFMTIALLKFGGVIDKLSTDPGEAETK